MATYIIECYNGSACRHRGANPAQAAQQHLRYHVHRSNLMRVAQLATIGSLQWFQPQFLGKRSGQWLNTHQPFAVRTAA